jgi:hypothetical protein
MDLVPEVKVIVYREGEAIEEAGQTEETSEAPAETSETAEA